MAQTTHATSEVHATALWHTYVDGIHPQELFYNAHITAMLLKVCKAYETDGVQASYWVMVRIRNSGSNNVSPITWKSTTLPLWKQENGGGGTGLLVGFPASIARLTLA